ncbi:arginase family protein [Orbus sturtevantii]|uniref:arginase family protein n=1 Tax=Orbus sturtevantii TaxID=3074109 RepID=UPI00370DC9BB
MNSDKRGLKTLRVKYPDWQGGNNPVYYFGAEFLSLLLPKNTNQKEITINVKKPDNLALAVEGGITGRQAVKSNIELAKCEIERESPDKIITIGGDCLVSQVPFDYLHGKYKEQLGIIWIDSHPDISNPDIFYNSHAMVLANLLHDGDRELSSLVSHPFKASQILYLGLQEPTQQEKQILAKLKINYQDSRKEKITLTQITDWIAVNNFKKIAIHLDLDVLDPKVFYSLYFNDPNLKSIPDNAAVGKMGLEELMNYLVTIFKATDVVGFSIAEYLPWDAYYLKNVFQRLDIFN